MTLVLEAFETEGRLVFSEKAEIMVPTEGVISLKEQRRVATAADALIGQVRGKVAFYKRQQKQEREQRASGDFDAIPEK